MIFVEIAILVGIGLARDPRKPPRIYIEKRAPRFTLKKVFAPTKTFSPKHQGALSRRLKGRTLRAIFHRRHSSASVVNC